MLVPIVMTVLHRPCMVTARDCAAPAPPAEQQLRRDPAMAHQVHRRAGFSRCRRAQQRLQHFRVDQIVLGQHQPVGERRLAHGFGVLVQREPGR